jgi:hypothetical protein
VTNTVSRTVSDETLNAIITIESAGKPRIKATTSSASGLFQFLDATWMGVVQKHRPDLSRGRTRAQVLDLRFDPKIAIELGARFTEDNQHAIGMDCTGGDLYLAHFLGTGDAKDFFRADPATPVTKLVTEGVIRANKSVMLNKDGSPKNAGQIRAWAARRMRDSAGHDWIAKYFDEPEPVPQQQPEETAEDIPDTQDAPATPLPRRDPVPPVEPATPTVVVPADAPPHEVQKRAEESAARDAETSPSWLKRQWRKVTGTIGSFLGMGAGFVFDWKLMAIVLGFIVFVAVSLILFMGPGNVREWIRKQVA